MLCIEPFNLFHGCASILCQIEDVHFALTVNDPHTDCCMTQRIQSVCFAREGGDLKVGTLHQFGKLPLNDFPRRCPIGVVGKEDEILLCEVGSA